MTKLDSILKIRDITLLTEVHIVKAMIFPVVTYRFEKWTIKKAECWRIDVFEEEKILESPLDSKKIKPVNPQGNQAWMFIGKTDAKAEAPILWAADAKNWLTGKDPFARKDWRQKEKWVAEHEMLGWHHQFMDMSLNFRKQWRAGKPDVLLSMGSHRVGHDLVIEQWRRENRCREEKILFQIC